MYPMVNFVPQNAVKANKKSLTTPAQMNVPSMPNMNSIIPATKSVLRNIFPSQRLSDAPKHVQIFFLMVVVFRNVHPKSHFLYPTATSALNIVPLTKIIAFLNHNASQNIVQHTLLLQNPPISVLLNAHIKFQKAINAYFNVLSACPLSMIISVFRLVQNTLFRCQTHLSAVRIAI